MAIIFLLTLNCILALGFLEILHKNQIFNSLNGGLFIWQNKYKKINTIITTHVSTNHVSLGFFWPLDLGKQRL
jgi:hypothetical protein